MPERIEGLKTRAGTAADKAAIMHILAETPEFTPAEVVVAEEVLDCYLNDPVQSGYYVLVADIADKVAGYICYGPTPLTESTWDIYWMATAPALKNHGIGKTLLALAEETIKARGGRLILIETSSKPSYENTRGFYQARGYAIVSRIPDFYAPGDDLVIFQKRVEE